MVSRATSLGAAPATELVLAAHSPPGRLHAQRRCNLLPWGLSSKNAGVGRHFLLQGIF